MSGFGKRKSCVFVNRTQGSGSAGSATSTPVLFSGAQVVAPAERGTLTYSGGMQRRLS
jgi:hypothetical protein